MLFRSQEDGNYLRAKGHGGFSAQDFLMRLAEGKAELADIAKAAAPVEKAKASKPESVAAPK